MDSPQSAPAAAAAAHTPGRQNPCWHSPKPAALPCVSGLTALSVCSESRPSCSLSFSQLQMAGRLPGSWPAAFPAVMKCCRGYRRCCCPAFQAGGHCAWERLHPFHSLEGADSRFASLVLCYEAGASRQLLCRIWKWLQRCWQEPLSGMRSHPHRLCHPRSGNLAGLECPPSQT